jgi:hypothetical protein
MGMMLHYNLIWNVLHYPCGIVPITKVYNYEAIEFEDHYEDAWTVSMDNSLYESQWMPIGL